MVGVKSAEAVIPTGLWQPYSQATVSNKPDRRGEHDISRKATAQGMSDRLRCPVCSCAFSFLHTRPRVQRASGIPCALWFQGVTRLAKLGRDRAARTRTPVHQRHCEEQL